MGKKSRKKGKSKPIHRPVTSPLTRINTQLSELFGLKFLQALEKGEVKGELDRIYHKIKPRHLFPTLLPAFKRSDQKVQEELDKLLPKWINESGYENLLLKYLRRFDIDREIRRISLSWLETIGIDKDQIEELRHLSHFYRAFIHKDDSQGVIQVFWYTNSQREKISGISFLLDFNPPWEGAVKDIIIFPQRDKEAAIDEFVRSWENRGMPMDELTERKARHEIFKHLLINEQEEIALPADLIASREVFLQNILSLEGLPDTPDFTVSDFDRLSKKGKSVESLRRYEQEVGRRVRLADGKEVIVMGDPFDENL